MLRIDNMRKSFTQHLLGGRVATVLQGVDLTVPPGSMVALTGASASGKSTLLRCVYRSCAPDAGTVTVRHRAAEVEMSGADERTVLWARRDLIGMCTQFLSAIPRVSALDLVAAEDVTRDRAADLLLSLGLDRSRLDVPPATFSGGERQMVALAIALARQRPLLLLDEATASLDPARRGVALDALVEAKRRGTTVLAVFHDVPDTPGLIDEVVTLRDGRVAA